MQGNNMSGEKKKFTLIFIQVAWVAELIAIMLYTMFAVPFMPIDRIELWLKFLPIFGLLIGAQGTAAGAGPLMADHIHKRRGGENE
jgi:hypothetical protein